MKKRIIATMLSVAVLMSMFPVAAAAAVPIQNNTGLLNIIGEQDVADSIIAVEVPTTLDFTLAPFAGAAQVAQEFQIVNRSNVPVMTNFYLTAQVPDYVQILTLAEGHTDGDFAPLDPASQSRILTLALNTAAEIGGVAPDVASGFHTTTDVTFASAAAFTPATNTAAAASASAVSEFSAAAASGVTRGSAQMGFALEAANFADDVATAASTLAAGNAGVAAFRLFGTMNSFAPWQAGDVEVFGTLWLTPVNPAALLAEAPLQPTNIVEHRRIDPGAMPAQPTPLLGFHGGGATEGVVIRSATHATVHLPATGSAAINIPFVGAAGRDIFLWVGTTDFTTGVTVNATQITMDTVAANAWRNLSGVTSMDADFWVYTPTGLVRHVITFTW